MRLSSVFLVFTAAGVTFSIGQAILPTAHAQSAASPLPAYQVSVNGVNTKHAAGGLEVSGQIVNRGFQPLTYTSVVVVFSNTAGKEIAHAPAYLTSGPVLPGGSAEFRSSVPEVPAFTAVSVRLREAGQAVTVEAASQSIATAQNPEKRRTTVW